MTIADGEQVEYDEGDVAVRIAVVGDRKFFFCQKTTLHADRIRFQIGGCGKSSLIWTLLEDRYNADVPPQIETVLIPPEVSPDGVLTAIVDYSSLFSILHAHFCIANQKSINL